MKGRKKSKDITVYTQPETDVLHADESDEINPDEAMIAKDIIIPTDILDKEDDEIEVKTSAALTRFDPLNMYLQEVKKIPLLSAEEEKSLAIQYSKSKSLIAAKQLVQANLWLVIKIAREYQNAAKNLLDLIQEGNIGLMEAVKNFDPFREVRLPSYASWWIKAYIVRYLIANFRMVKIGTTQAQRRLFFNLKKEKEKLEREGFFPAPKLLAEKLNVKESEVIEMEQRMLGSDVSINAPIGEDSDTDMLAILSDNHANAEDILSAKENQQALKDNFDSFSKTLNDKEKAIFKDRLLSEEKATLQELSDRFSISKERVRQIEERLVQKLKEFLLEKMDSADKFQV